MKRWLSAGFIFLFINSVYALPAEGKIQFTLAKILKGDSCPQILKNIPVIVDYHYNFERNMGQAHLRRIKSLDWSETLYPLGLSNYYAFMSDMKPKLIQLDDNEVTVYRIIFHLYKNNQAKLFMMIGEQGNCIMESAPESVDGFA
ncbi:hypothetical protein [Legionella israelensis]|uniref:Uncharacterized protein n=1 Tax=Legionella israelensis TaxID=454 RepID=A0A0W0WNN9_9GAMM|nr:hypothetical protein [Legionella israelensis]KTD33912.1 hypothetical protein Lisr_0280 [Legionella israelensis]QBS08922.1 hypothetical protein E4T55_03045 [Legionella israelensis]SCX82466.1 hypothetical protein SAMN02746069_00351 [Legionella israelensis DSM 19235]STX58612.1 Uncharacterised protein [Legionella israelensis]